MKVITIALWLYCVAGPADYAIPVVDLETCERLGPAIAQEVRLEQGNAQFECRFKEEPPPDDGCGWGT